MHFFTPLMKYQTGNITNNPFQNLHQKKKKKKLNNKKTKNEFSSREVIDLYTENYTTFIKETEDDSKKWKDIPCFLYQKNIVKMACYPKQSTDLMQSLSNYP